MTRFKLTPMVGGAVVPLVMTLLLMLTWTVPTRARQSAEPPTPVEEWMGVMARNGGRWTAVNPVHKEAERTPTAYAYAFSWSLDRWILNNQIIGVFGEQEIVFWETRFTWDPVAKTIRVHQAGYDGAFATGVMRKVSDSVLETDLRLVAPDGAVTVYRDRTSVTGPDTFVDTSSEIRDGEWVEQLKLTFNRQPSPQRHPNLFDHLPKPLGLVQ